MDSAMAEGCEEMAAISARWLLRNFQATKERMAVITTIFTTVTICCLENRLVRPDSGLRRLNCGWMGDRKSTRLKSSHLVISYAVLCFKKKKKWNSSQSVPPTGRQHTRGALWPTAVRS